MKEYDCRFTAAFKEQFATIPAGSPLSTFTLDGVALRASVRAARGDKPPPGCPR